jgi:hypothetical protein
MSTTPKEDIVRKLRLEYQYPQEDPTSRALDSVRTLFLDWGRSRDTHAILREAASLISKNLRIREVGMGLMGPDGLFRFVEFVGYRPEAETANRKLVFKEADFVDSSVYKGVTISKLTTAYFAEDDPYDKDQEETYNRPMLLKGKRMAMDESIEGDYLSTNIVSPDGVMLGWIEISGTTAWRLPDAQSIKWIELVASVLGQFLSSSGAAQGR